ncbi:unnamed protein product [Pylaiella littoralis]
MPRVRVTTPRSWRRTGPRQIKHRNRRLCEKQRRRRRQRRGTGGLRRRAPIRGGANLGEGQVYERPKRNKKPPRASDETEDMSAKTRYDDAWFNEKWPLLDGSELTEQQKKEKEKVRLWKEEQKQREIDDARCRKCKKKTTQLGEPIVFCDDCGGKGARHFMCMNPQPDTIPDEEDEWFCGECTKKRGGAQPVQPVNVDGPTGSTQPQPQPMNVDGPTESTQQQQTLPQPHQQPTEQAPVSTVPVSTVANTSTATKRKGRTTSKPACKAGKAKAGSTPRGVTAPQVRTAGKREQTRTRLQKSVDMTEYARVLEQAWNDIAAEFMENSREKADQKAEEFEGTCHRAKNEPPYSIASIPLIAKLLAEGLCDECSGSIEFLNGVFFKGSALAMLEPYYNWEYMFDPLSIGVDLGETVVEIKNKVHVLQSFDHGKYTLTDGTEISQWGLLKHRKDGGVTLEDDLRRFIIHLVTTDVNMMAHVVPLLKQKKRKSVTTYEVYALEPNRSSQGRDKQRTEGGAGGNNQAGGHSAGPDTENLHQSRREGHSACEFLGHRKEQGRLARVRGKGWIAATDKFSGWP